MTVLVQLLLSLPHGLPLSIYESRVDDRGCRNPFFTLTFQYSESDEVLNVTASFQWCKWEDGGAALNNKRWPTSSLLSICIVRSWLMMTNRFMAAVFSLWQVYHKDGMDYSSHNLCITLCYQRFLLLSNILKTLHN